jgi:hypothetical protein
MMREERTFCAPKDRRALKSSKQLASSDQFNRRQKTAVIPQNTAASFCSCWSWPRETDEVSTESTLIAEREGVNEREGVKE